MDTITKGLYTTKEIESKKELNTFLDEMIHIFQHNVDRKGTAEDLKKELKRPAVGLWKFGIIDGVEKWKNITSSNNNGQKYEEVSKTIKQVIEQPVKKKEKEKRKTAHNSATCECCG